MDSCLKFLLRAIRAESNLWDLFPKSWSANTIARHCTRQCQDYCFLVLRTLLISWARRIFIFCMLPWGSSPGPALTSSLDKLMDQIRRKGPCCNSSTHTDNPHLPWTYLCWFGFILIVANSFSFWVASTLPTTDRWRTDRTQVAFFVCMAHGSMGYCHIGLSTAIPPPLIHGLVDIARKACLSLFLLMAWQAGAAWDAPLVSAWSLVCSLAVASPSWRYRPRNLRKLFPFQSMRNFFLSYTPECCRPLSLIIPRPAILWAAHQLSGSCQKSFLRYTVGFYHPFTVCVPCASTCISNEPRSQRNSRWPFPIVLVSP